MENFCFIIDLISITDEVSVKIQGYQTEAVEDTVNVFRGQPKIEPKHYRRDVGCDSSGQQRIITEEDEAEYLITGFALNDDLLKRLEPINFDYYAGIQ